MKYPLLLSQNYIPKIIRMLDEQIILSVSFK